MGWASFGDMSEMAFDEDNTLALSLTIPARSGGIDVEAQLDGKALTNIVASWSGKPCCGAGIALAYKNFPRDHRAKIRSTNRLERLNTKIKRRTNAVGIFPNEVATTCRYMALETVAAICDSVPIDPAGIAAL
jgi:hypothetical protein